MWSVLTALWVLPLTALLVVRFWSMSVEAGLGAIWQLVLTGLALAIGLRAPLVRVVAEDGSTSSRRRDELEAALAEERLAAEEAIKEVRELLDDAARAHDDYLARLRPTVVHAAGASMVQAENALGLLTVLLGRGGALARRDSVGLSSTDDFALLRWTFEGAPEVDNRPLLVRDRTYRQQVEQHGGLRGRLAGITGDDHGPRRSA